LTVAVIIINNNKNNKNNNHSWWPKVKKFCDYICDNYINETSKCNPKMWASSSISSERTTNSCESFHSKLNTQFNKAHPNIFLFSHVLNLKIQTDT